MNNKYLERLHTLMLEAEIISRKGQLIEHRILEMTERAVGEEQAEVLNNSIEFQDTLVAGYSNAEFNYPKFEDFKTKIIEILGNELREENEVRGK